MELDVSSGNHPNELGMEISVFCVTPKLENLASNRKVGKTTAHIRERKFLLRFYPLLSNATLVAPVERKLFETDFEFIIEETAHRHS